MPRSRTSMSKTREKGFSHVSPRNAPKPSSPQKLAKLAGLVGLDLRHALGRHAILVLAGLALLAGTALPRHYQTPVSPAIEFSEVAVWHAHQGAVNWLAFNSAGDLMASAGEDGRVLLTDPSRAPTSSFELRHSKAVQRVVFDPGGEWVASGDENGTIKLWRPSQGSIQELSGHSKAVTALAFDVTGKYLVSGGEDKQAIEWNVGTTRELRRLKTRGPVSLAFAVGPGSIWLVDEDRQLAEWDLLTGARLRQLRDEADALHSAAGFVANKWLLLGTTDRAFRKGSMGAIVSSQSPTGIARLAEVRLYDTTQSRLQKSISVGEGIIRSLSVSGDGNFLAVALKKVTKSTLSIWDLKFGTPVAVLLEPRKEDLTAVSFSPDGRWLAAGDESGDIVIWKVGGVFPRVAPYAEVRREKFVFKGPTEPLLSFARETVLALMDVDAPGLGEEVALAASDQLRVGVSTVSNVRLIERSRIQSILSEQDLQHSGRTDANTAVRLGRLLNAGKVGFGSLTRLGQAMQLSFFLVDVETGRIEGSRQVGCGACSLEEVTDLVSQMQTVLVPNESQSTKATAELTGRGLASPTKTSVPPASVPARDEDSLLKTDLELRNMVYHAPEEGYSGLKGTVRLYRRSIAVVVGISDYNSLPRLSGAARDAESVTETLQGLGFEVHTLINQEASRTAIAALLGDAIAPGLDREDRVLIFYAGHAVTLGEGDDKMGYLMPVDSLAKQPAATGISMRELQAWVSRYPCKHVLFVADACYSGLALSTRSVSLPDTLRNYLKEVTEKEVRVTITAGRADQEAYEWKGRGLLTFFFLEALKGGADANHDGILTSAELYTYIEPRVAQTAMDQWGARQNPQMGRRGQGEFIFLVASR